MRTDLFTMKIQAKALELECIGMRRHGPSVYSMIKRHYGLRGNKQSVLEQFKALIDRVEDEATRQEILTQPFVH